MNAASREEAASETGPIGPVAVFAFLVLLAASPIMRGGNRQVAQIVLEGLALLFLVAMLARPAASGAGWSISRAAFLFLVSSPLWLAVVYLIPIPFDWWRATPGRDVYPALLANAGMELPTRLPLSLLPDETASSLFAGIPIAAAFLAGYCMLLKQLRVALATLVGVAFLEVAVGLAQLAGGHESSFYFGAIARQPYGTFANPNHFANYVGMALTAYVWLAATSLAKGGYEQRAQGFRPEGNRAVFMWIAGGVVLLTGILMSRSRGAAVSALPAALCAAALAAGSVTHFRSMRNVLLIVVLGFAAVLAFMGGEVVLRRFELHTTAVDASFRALLASTTLQGAFEFWPWGAGWGTYAGVYPRFQPPAVAGIADYAHQDYAQLLFEGGIFSVFLMLAFGFLAAQRAALLVTTAVRKRYLSREKLAASLCGLGLAGFLVHSLVEFNMHIPANAIAAALLAGAFLRPLGSSGGEEAPDD